MPAKPLSPTMRAALDAVRTHPAQPAGKLPGGTGTVRALMRRQLVEVAGEDWLVYLPEHEHRFRSLMHLDGCHHYSNQYRCECGVQLVIHGERSPRQDPYSIVWMEGDGDSVCTRCEQLLAGARPRYEMVIARG